MKISFNVFWSKSLGTFYKDNSIDTLGQQATVDINLEKVSRIYVNFQVGENSYTDNVEILDEKNGLIRIPFKTDVIKQGVNKFELVAVMDNGDVLPSQTFSYKVDESLENPDAVEADTNYPLLIELINEVDGKIADMDISVQKVDTSIENMINDISNYKEVTTNALNSDMSGYKETTTNELEESFNNYSNNTTSNITRVLDNKIAEVDNTVSTKSNEITQTLNNEINKVDNTLSAKVNEVNSVLSEKVNEIDVVLDSSVSTINTKFDEKSSEVDNKVNTKIAEIDNNVNTKINEVNTSLNNKINEVNEVIEEVELSEQVRKEEHTELVNELSSYSSDMNNVKDRVDVLEAKVTDNEVIVDLKNKVNNHEERITTSEKTIRHQGILLNALNDLDDTISIEEEGTVISLPQSDDGKIIIDELQGNTLVNYCTNGSEELTLNNEINVQGANDIALTDTIDSGKVDVMCEGNTLVNLMPSIDYSSPNANNGTQLNYFSKVFPLIQNNKTYTIIFNNYCFTEFYLSNLGLNWINIVNKNIFTFTTSANDSTFDNSFPKNFMFKTTRELTDAELMNLNFILLEGDYTNKPIPSYFEGMKSVGECEDNKIEILINNKNLLGELSIGGLYGASGEDDVSATTWRKTDFVAIGKNHRNVVHTTNNTNRKFLFQYDSNKKIIGTYSTSTNITLLDDCAYIRTCYEDYNGTQYQLEVGKVSTNYTPREQNKIKLSLNEPLRGLPSGVCDKFVKQGGKWYVERNCGEVVLDGDINVAEYNNFVNVNNKDYTNFYIRLLKDNSKKSSEDEYRAVICEKIPYLSYSYPNVESFGISQYVDPSATFVGCIPTSKLNNENIENYFIQNPAKIVYSLATPTYEEITDPQVITYLDTTHISTNSTIPCNMQIKNSGYNAIIKPSTQYTVVFDTNTSGEVNIGLGGAKTSTTNGVTTITTPSTLTDDSLMLYGKGIKASNVRLLEGDKTNYIPSFFEGMKSCFEDNKVKIISRNKNLFTNYEDFINIKGINNICISSSYTEGCSRLDIAFYDNNFNRITDCLVGSGSYFYKISAGELAGCYRLTGNKTQLNEPICVNDKPTYMKLIDSEFKYGYKKYNNIQIEEGSQATSYIPHKSNSIQLQLNEPLRAVGDVKDRFVLKDGKLMIERNCREVVLDGSEDWREYEKTNTNVAYISKRPSNSKVHSKLLSDNLIDSNGFNNGTINSLYFGTTSINVLFYLNSTLNSFKQWLSNNPTTVVYQLEEPTYEEVPYETQKLILECFENGTLFIDTLIPPTVSVTYSANKPVVAKLNEVEEVSAVNTETLEMTQIAVDFLLMSDFGESGESSVAVASTFSRMRGGVNMGAYFASRIMKRALNYVDVVKRYPQYKEDIDFILIAEGYAELIVEF